jgi:hypothetical protein
MQNYEDRTYWRGWRHGAAVGVIATAVVFWLDPWRWIAPWLH